MPFYLPCWSYVVIGEAYEILIIGEQLQLWDSKIPKEIIEHYARRIVYTH